MPVHNPLMSMPLTVGFLTVVRNILYSSGNLPDDQYSLPSLAGQSVSLNIYQKMAFCNSDQMVHYCD